jgi:hypothetical protein
VTPIGRRNGGGEGGRKISAQTFSAQRFSAQRFSAQRFPPKDFRPNISAHEKYAQAISVSKMRPKISAQTFPPTKNTPKQFQFQKCAQRFPPKDFRPSSGARLGLARGRRRSRSSALAVVGARGRRRSRSSAHPNPPRWRAGSSCAPGGCVRYGKARTRVRLLVHVDVSPHACRAATVVAVARRVCGRGRRADVRRSFGPFVCAG